MKALQFSANAALEDEKPSRRKSREKPKSSAAG